MSDEETQPTPEEPDPPPEIDRKAAREGQASSALKGRLDYVDLAERVVQGVTVDETPLKEE